MQRRHILKLLTFFLASAVAENSLSKLSLKNKNQLPIKPKNRKHLEKIAIIGAGVAGLAAAQLLKKQGYSVTVYEALSRIGGRLYTDLDSLDLPVDMGASWIHGIEENPIYEIAQQLRAVTIATSYENTISYDQLGKKISAKTQDLIEDFSLKITKVIDNFQESDANDLSLQHLISKFLEKDYAKKEYKILIDFILNSVYEQEYSGSADLISTRYFDDSTEFDGDDVLFKEGYQVIANFLARDLDIKLSTPINKVDWTSSEVLLHSKSTVDTFSKVIITVPLGVLKNKKITFTPSLPNWKQKAISDLQMGTLNKLYLQFPKTFWPLDADWIEFIGRKNNLWVEWVNLSNKLNRPILLGFNAARAGELSESLSDDKLVDSAMDALKSVFGNDIPQPVKFARTKWHSQEFFGGSYSFNPVGVSQSSRKDLAKSVDSVLYFAGEATSSKQFATVHGAYLSGIAAAKELIEKDEFE